MKKGNMKSLIIFAVALSIIITTSVCIPMLNGFATGVSGSPNPTVRTYINNLNGNSIRANAYESGWGVSKYGYPRLITNGYQLQATVWAYDSAGIKNLTIRLIKNNETDTGRVWEPYGNVQEIINQTYSPYTNYEDKIFTFRLMPGRYVLMAMATTNDGRTTTKIDYIEYGSGNLIATDFDTAYRKTSTGWLHFCAIYDLNTVGVNVPGSTLGMTNINNSSYSYNSYDKSIQRDPTDSNRYLVTGTVNPSVSGTYRTWINVQKNNGTYEAFDFLKYTYN